MFTSQRAPSPGTITRFMITVVYKLISQGVSFRVMVCCEEFTSIFLFFTPAAPMLRTGLRLATCTSSLTAIEMEQKMATIGRYTMYLYISRSVDLSVSTFSLTLACPELFRIYESLWRLFGPWDPWTYGSIITYINLITQGKRCQLGVRRLRASSSLSHGLG